MTPEELTQRRKAIGFNQSEMARELGMSLRGYQKLEMGDAPIRQSYDYAVSYIGLVMAAMKSDASVATANARRVALEVADLVRGQ